MRDWMRDWTLRVFVAHPTYWGGEREDEIYNNNTEPPDCFLVSGAAFSEVSAAARRVKRTELSFDDERGRRGASRDTLALPTMMRRAS